jgi:hypothetical protein
MKRKPPTGTNEQFVSFQLALTGMMAYMEMKKSGSNDYGK